MHVAAEDHYRRQGADPLISQNVIPCSMKLKVSPQKRGALTNNNTTRMKHIFSLHSGLGGIKWKLIEH